MSTAPHGRLGAAGGITPERLEAALAAERHRHDAAVARAECRTYMTLHWIVTVVGWVTLAALLSTGD